MKTSATTCIYTLSLHDALPIYLPGLALVVQPEVHESGVIRQLARCHWQGGQRNARQLQADEIADFLHRGHLALLRKQFVDRKSTRLNSSHVRISYAVFCLKKKI